MFLFCMISSSVTLGFQFRDFEAIYKLLATCNVRFNNRLGACILDGANDIGYMVRSG